MKAGQRLGCIGENFNFRGVVGCRSTGSVPPGSALQEPYNSSIIVGTTSLNPRPLSYISEPSAQSLDLQ